MMVSFVIPVYNEMFNIETSYIRLIDELKEIKNEFEIIFIDDGSTDDTYNVLKLINAKDCRVIVVKFKRNFGQHAAVLAGFLNAKGDIIVNLDADFRNEPGDISKILEMMGKGYDVVKGWRIKRDATFARKLYSIISNNVLRLLVRAEIHDYGCALGAFRKSLLEGIGEENNTELIRYIHLYCLKNAGKVAEVRIKDISGNGMERAGSKYYFSKLLRLFFSIIKVLLVPAKGKSLSDFYVVEAVLTH